MSQRLLSGLTRNSLLNLATQLLRADLPADKAELPTNIAVQITVTAMKAFYDAVYG